MINTIEIKSQKVLLRLDAVGEGINEEEYTFVSSVFTFVNRAQRGTEMKTAIDMLNYIEDKMGSSNLYLIQTEKKQNREQGKIVFKHFLAILGQYL